MSLKFFNGQSFHTDAKAWDMCQIIRDYSGYHRAMSMKYEPQKHQLEEVSVAQNMRYLDACALAARLNAVEDVMSS